WRPSALPFLVLHGAPLVAGAPERVAERRDDRADAADEEVARAVVVRGDPAARDLAGERGGRRLRERERRSCAPERLPLVAVEELRRGRCRGEERRARGAGRERAVEHRPDRRDAGAVGDEDGLAGGRPLEDERAPRAGEAERRAGREAEEVRGAGAVRDPVQE